MDLDDDKVFRQVLGLETRGCGWGLGRGPSSTEFFGPQSSWNDPVRMLEQQKVDISRQKEEIELQRQEMEWTKAGVGAIDAGDVAISGSNPGSDAVDDTLVLDTGMELNLC